MISIPTIESDRRPNTTTIRDLDWCAKRFWYELVPNHNCTNVLASQKRQWRERKAS